MNHNFFDYHKFIIDTETNGFSGVKQWGYYNFDNDDDKNNKNNTYTFYHKIIQLSCIDTILNKNFDDDNNKQNNNDDDDEEYIFFNKYIDDDDIIINSYSSSIHKINKDFLISKKKNNLTEKIEDLICNFIQWVYDRSILNNNNCLIMMIGHNVKFDMTIIENHISSIPKAINLMKSLFKNPWVWFDSLKLCKELFPDFENKSDNDDYIILECDSHPYSLKSLSYIFFSVKSNNDNNSSSSSSNKKNYNYNINDDDNNYDDDDNDDDDDNNDDNNNKNNDNNKNNNDILFHNSLYDSFSLFKIYKEHLEPRINLSKINLTFDIINDNDENLNVSSSSSSLSSSENFNKNNEKLSIIFNIPTYIYSNSILYLSTTMFLEPLKNFKGVKVWRLNLLTKTILNTFNNMGSEEWINNNNVCNESNISCFHLVSYGWALFINNSIDNGNIIFNLNNNNLNNKIIWKSISKSIEYILRKECQIYSDDVIIDLLSICFSGCSKFKKKEEEEKKEEEGEKNSNNIKSFLSSSSSLSSQKIYYKDKNNIYSSFPDEGITRIILKNNMFPSFKGDPISYLPFIFSKNQSKFFDEILNCKTSHDIYMNFYTSNVNISKELSILPLIKKISIWINENILKIILSLDKYKIIYNELKLYLEPIEVKKHFEEIIPQSKYKNF